ncbi:hypothetical protein [Vallicoccus soli]|uniref:Uncharacterized protein n=1 Tax=Vallicoccus soli TaxID=2339232 RepID=A0A3A3Z120_9ACTN|nr:hypothetical protein [Vallicoccus soli]RJK97950.1 hypothetical protein D5H78_03025 [Vallicoccus soli]
MLLAVPTPATTPTPAVDEYDVTPGLLGFLVIVAVGLALWVLLRSMSRHLGRIDVPHDERPRARRGLASRAYAPVVADRGVAPVRYDRAPDAADGGPGRGAGDDPAGPAGSLPDPGAADGGGRRGA